METPQKILTIIYSVIGALAGGLIAFVFFTFIGGITGVIGQTLKRIPKMTTQLRVIQNSVHTSEQIFFIFLAAAKNMIRCHS